MENKSRILIVVLEYNIKPCHRGPGKRRLKTEEILSESSEKNITKIKITVIQNDKMENFDLKEIHLK